MLYLRSALRNFCSIYAIFSFWSKKAVADASVYYPLLRDLNVGDYSVFILLLMLPAQKTVGCLSIAFPLERSTL